MDSTITASDGSSVYDNEIMVLADEYVDSLDDPERIRETNVFSGMIKYIYIKRFKAEKIDYSDIEYIDSIWDTYTMLCYKCNKNPTIQEFSVLVNISRETFNSWKNGNTRNYKYYDSNNNIINNLALWISLHPDEEYRKELSTSHSDTVKKWLTECESCQYKGATEKGNVGSIFALKACFGYVETVPKQVVNPIQEAKTASELPVFRASVGNIAQQNQGLLDVVE